MDANYTYLAIDLGSLIVPLIFSFHPKLLFYKKWTAFGYSNLIVCLLFILWDVYYTSIGVWGFNPRYLSGLYVGNLPIEEVLFFICIPFSCIYTYHCLKIFFPDRSKIPYEEITIIMSTLLVCFGTLYMTHIYTSVSFILLALTLSILTFKCNLRWMANFYFTFLIILVPFCIVNGILTGTGLDEPVVWYDNTQNMGIRIGTIPVEDIFYGMLMLVLNTALFEYFDGKQGTPTPIVNKSVPVGSNH